MKKVMRIRPFSGSIVEDDMRVITPDQFNLLGDDGVNGSAAVIGMNGQLSAEEPVHHNTKFDL
jgi:hypothetical protein